MDLDTLISKDNLALLEETMVNVILITPTVNIQAITMEVKEAFTEVKLE